MIPPLSIPAGSLKPKLFTVFRAGYSRHQLLKDIAAGVTVGIVALPLAIAFAVASGVKPEQGLYTAIVAGFVVSALGGSRVQIGGPTGAFIVLVYGIVQQHGYEGLAVATLMAGLLLVGMAVARLGTVIQYVPYPVTVGFTSGIALVIAISQLRDLLGLRMDRVPAETLAKLSAYAEHLSSWNPYAVVLSALTASLVLFWPRLTHRVPGSLVAILTVTLLVHGLNLPVETVGSRFGGVPTSLPVPALPPISWESVRTLLSPAIAIALLGAIESLLSAVVADGMIASRHRPNAELLAQGIANVVSPLFAGIPATGAIARTATNVKNGARTPIAGMIHALTLLLIMLLFGRWAGLIPICALAGILLVVAYHMSEWYLFLRLFRSPRSDVMVLLVTFLLTVLVDLTVALEAGVVLAAFLFMRRMAGLSHAGIVTGMLAEEEPLDDPLSLCRRAVPEGVEVFEIFGPFFFGAASKFKDALAQVEGRPPILILRMREVHTVDATGLRALEDLYLKTRREGTTLLLSGVHAQPLAALERAGLLQRVGVENVFSDIDHALAAARQRLGLPPAVPLDTLRPD